MSHKVHLLKTRKAILIKQKVAFNANISKYISFWLLFALHRYFRLISV